MKKLTLLILTCLSVSTWSADALSLQECYQRALENHPSLNPYAHEINVQNGLIEQAGLSPNPNLSVEAENFLGTGDLQGVESFETTVGISQQIETANKREKRIQLAEAEKQLAQSDLTIAQFRVLYQTTQAYINVMTAQEFLDLQQSLLENNQAIYNTIQQTVAAGRDSPILESRSRIQVSSVQVQLNEAKRTLQQAQINLAAQWGSISPDFGVLESKLLPLPNLLSLEQQIDLIENHPQLHQDQQRVELYQNALTLEEANAVPDYEIGAGVRYMADADAGAFVLEFSIPLPIHHRNQGAIRAEQERIAKSEALLDEQRFELKTQLHEVYQEYHKYLEKINTLQSDIIPDAQTTFESVQEGFRLGKFPYLDVLDAQQDLFELKEQVLLSASNAHQAINQINLLTANYQPLNLLKEESKP